MNTEHSYNKMFRIITQCNLKLSGHHCETKKEVQQIENPVVGQNPETVLFFTFQVLFTEY
jgi:hypothetical protein